MDERLKELFAEEKINNMKKANILLVGVGGVGSFCFETLIRSGIKNITIIDFDEYELSNLNRQLHSNLNNIGIKKVKVLKEYAKNIDPNINVTILEEYINKDSIIDFSQFDYIIDACDSIEAKVLLIKKSLEFNKKIVCACGVGNRIDPTKIIKTKLSKTESDPLAKKLRSELRSENVSLNIDVIASKEIPIKSKKISSYICVSSYAGLLLADTVIKNL